MSQPPYWKRMLAVGVRFAQFRHARGLAADLVSQTQQARGQLGGLIGGLVETGRRRNEELGRIVRSGADRQFGGLGLVTKTDLVTFERRMRPAPVAKTAQAKKKVTARPAKVTKPTTASTRKRAR